MANTVELKEGLLVFDKSDMDIPKFRRILRTGIDRQFANTYLGKSITITDDYVVIRLGDGPVMLTWESLCFILNNMIRPCLRNSFPCTLTIKDVEKADAGYGRWETFSLDLRSENLFRGRW